MVVARTCRFNGVMYQYEQQFSSSPDDEIILVIVKCYLTKDLMMIIKSRLIRKHFADVNEARVVDAYHGHSFLSVTQICHTAIVPKNKGQQQKK